MRVTHQTVRLGAGKHRSPQEGACVMELASMLAGEEFSDRPRCVSPVVGAFLRVYNDFVGDVRRQDLRAIASTVVGSAAPESVEEARLRRLVGWSDELWALRRRRPLLGRLRRALGRSQATADPEVGARYAIDAIDDEEDGSHAAAIALVDELCGLSALAAAESWTSRGDGAPCRQPARLGTTIDR